MKREAPKYYLTHPEDYFPMIFNVVITRQRFQIKQY